MCSSNSFSGDENKENKELKKLVTYTTLIRLHTYEVIISIL